MSLSFQSLAALAALTTASNDHKIPIWTPDGYRNIELSTLQTYINQPILGIIDDISGGGSGPSIWPAARSITLTGPVTGTTSLDGSTNVTLATTVNTSQLTFGAGSIPQNAVASLSLDLGSLSDRLDTIEARDTNNLSAPLGIKVLSGTDAIIIKNAAGTRIASVGYDTGVLKLINGSANYSFSSTGAITYTNGVQTGNVWTSLTFNPSDKLGVSDTAAAATRLATGRSIALTGAVTGNATFDGSVGINIVTTLSNVPISSVTNLSAELLARVQYKTEVADGVDLNTVTDPGVYFKINAVADYATFHYPLLSTMIMTVTRAGSSVTQQIYCIAEKRQFVRYFDGSDWTSWYEQWTSNSFALTDFARTVHTHDAADIISGKLNPARIGKGEVGYLPNTATPPGTTNRSWSYDLRTGADVGLTGAGYVTTLTLTPGVDADTGLDHQLIFDNAAGGLYYRKGDRSAGWSATLRKIWDSVNFDPANPVPTNGILQLGSSTANYAKLRWDGYLSINGGAYSRLMTAADVDPSLFVLKRPVVADYSNADGLNGTLSYAVSGSTALGTPLPYSTTWNLGDNGDRDGQFSWSYTAGSPRISFRSRTTASWNPWVELYHTGNFAPSNYFDKASYKQLDNAATYITNWDDATSNGWYMARGAANSPLGETDTAWYMGTVRRHNSDWITQELYSFTLGVGSKWYRRWKQGGVWSAWTTDMVTGALKPDRIVLGLEPGVDNSIGCSNWFRSSGATGWYSVDYGGGIYMNDTTFVRTYNDKAMAANYFQSTGGFNPSAGWSNTAFRAQGSYGGGYAMRDGVNDIVLCSVGGALTVLEGTNNSVASVMQLTPTGKLTLTNGAESAVELKPNGARTIRLLANSTATGLYDVTNNVWPLSIDNTNNVYFRNQVLATLFKGRPDGSSGVAFGVGDDTTINDIGVANTLGIYGVQDSGSGGIKLGSGGPTLFGSGGILNVNAPIVTTADNGLRIVQGNYGLIHRQDGSSYWILVTNSGDQYGLWNNLRPFQINLATGTVSCAHNLYAADFIINSDGSLKRDIEPLKFKNPLNPVTYKLTDSDVTDIGFIAQDFLKDYPEVVDTKDDGLLALKYPRVTAILAAQNNAQQAEIDSLKERLVALEKYIQQQLEVKS